MISVALHRSNGVPIERDLDPAEGDTETAETPLLDRHQEFSNLSAIAARLERMSESEAAIAVEIVAIVN